MLTLRERGFKSNFKGIFGFDYLSSEEEVKRKIMIFVNTVIKVEYKKSNDLNILEEVEKYILFLENYFVLDQKLEIVGIKETFLNIYKKEMILLFKDTEVKDITYKYKHFYYLNFSTISNALKALCLYRHNDINATLVLKNFNITDDILEKYKEYITELNNTGFHKYVSSYFNNTIVKENKILNSLSINGINLRDTKEIANFYLEKERMKEYFLKNDNFNFEEIIDFVEKDEEFFKENKLKEKALYLLKYLLTNVK